MWIWKVRFSTGLTDRARGRHPEEAALRVARAYFGNQAYVRRVTGRPGSTGTFVALKKTRWGEKALVMFDVLAKEGRSNAERVDTSR